MRDRQHLRRIAVIGAGIAGRSFARQLLLRSYRVMLEDVLPANLRQALHELTETAPPGANTALELASTVEDAVRSADLAIDFVPDELESKLEILSMIDRMAPPKTILLTPTDTLSISDLASCTYRPERCFGLSGLARDRVFPGSGDVTLLHPSSPDKEAQAGVEALLDALDLRWTARFDPMPSMLTGR